MSIETRNIRFPRLAMVVRLLFALFLFGTGVMTMGFAVNGYPVSESTEKFYLGQNAESRAANIWRAFSTIPSTTDFSPKKEKPANSCE